MYAVRKGRNTGIYETWDECQEQVKGFKGAEFRKFGNLEDAEKYIGGGSVPNGYFYGVMFEDGSGGVFDNWEDCSNAVVGKSNCRYKKFKQRENAESFAMGEYVDTLPESVSLDIPTYFTDGNYKDGSVGCGFVLVENGKVNKFCCAVSGNNRNLTGELASVMLSIKHAIEKGYPQIQIISDYNGIELLATGAWTAKNAEFIDYVKFIERVDVDIRFTTISGHSGVEYNELADKLSKAGIKSEVKMSWKDIVNLDGYIG